MAIPRGPFEEDADQIQEFITQVVRELAPVGLQERAEATQIAALYVRRHRLLELGAEALACATRISTAEMLADLDDPFSVIADEPGTERSAFRALRSPAFEHLPRYEAQPEPGAGPVPGQIPAVAGRSAADARGSKGRSWTTRRPRGRPSTGARLSHGRRKGIPSLVAQ